MSNVYRTFQKLARKTIQGYKWKKTERKRIHANKSLNQSISSVLRLNVRPSTGFKDRLQKGGVKISRDGDILVNAKKKFIVSGDGISTWHHLLYAGLWAEKTTTTKQWSVFRADFQIESEIDSLFKRKVGETSKCFLWSLKIPLFMKGAFCTNNMTGRVILLTNQ